MAHRYRARFSRAVSTALVALAAVVFVAAPSLGGDVERASLEITEPYEARSPGLVELFTSLGCVACRSAETSFARLTRQDDVVALAYHVDFFDTKRYRDPFSQRDFSRRQAGYASTVADGELFTPQVVVDGREAVLGSNSVAVRRSLARSTSSRRVDLDLRVERGHRGIEVEIDLEGSRRSDAISVVVYSTTVEVEDPRAGNRKVELHNVVRARETVRLHKSSARARLPLDRSVAQDDLAVAVIVQDGDLGPVVATTSLAVPSTSDLR